MNDRVGELKAEELDLDNEKISLEKKKDNQEEEKTELVIGKRDLDEQKAEKNRLLAESKTKEAELTAEYQKNLRQVSALDTAIIAYAIAHPEEMVDEGWVNTGEIIGYVGLTGNTDGEHLHFGLNSGFYYTKENSSIGDWGYFWSDVNLFSNGYLREGGNSWLYWSRDNWWSPLIYRGSLPLPIAGQYILMTQNEHQGNAIDLVSYSQNALGYKNYGVPVYAIMSGNLSKGTERVYGGKYAQIVHSNGQVSIYLHLR